MEPDQRTLNYPLILFISKSGKSIGRHLSIEVNRSGFQTSGSVHPDWIYNPLRNMGLSPIRIEKDNNVLIKVWGDVAIRRFKGKGGVVIDAEIHNNLFANI